jgi:type IV pilus secretin PilQ/predicted competence protein
MRTISLLLCSAGILTLGTAVAQEPGGVVPAAAPVTSNAVPAAGAPATAAPPSAAPGGTDATAPAAPASTGPALASGSVTDQPAPIEPPPVTGPADAGLAPTPAGDQAAQSGTAGTVATTGTAATTGTIPDVTPTSRGLNEFSGDDVAQVLRLLARQARISLVVSDKISDATPPMKVTMRLEGKTPMEAINIIVFAKGLTIVEKDGVYYVKTKEEKDAEPTESASYTFSYATAEKVAPLLNSELESKVPSQFDARTNTIFYREVGSNMDKIKLFLATIDAPTQQVMIEARLVEVTANPNQSYGFNWGGVVGNSSSPQTFHYGGSQPGTSTINLQTNPTTGAVTPISVPSTLPQVTTNASSGTVTPSDFILNAQSGIGGLFRALSGQFAILSVPQMTLTMRLLNEDSDAEFLANPRIVTSNNQQATIKITRNQPVPQLNFNEQTAQAVFGGFQDKEYGNTLNVTPCINKDDFVTLNVKPEISNKVGDSVFTFSGATVSSPIIDKRDIESTVVIKSGDTLAIGGLLQDEVTKGANKVPVLGDIPVLGYAFQEHINARTKRNLLVFVTPTIIKQGYGTGLEDQVNGLHHSGEEYADPNGWRNNAQGAIRLVPKSRRQMAADYPKPGVPDEPAHADVDYRGSAMSSGN